MGAAIGILGGLALFIPSSALAGPWAKEAGQFYGKAFSSYYWANESFATSDEGQVIGAGSYAGLTSGVYGEVGLGHNLMAVVLTPYVVGANRDETATWLNAGAGDFEMGLQYQLPIPLPTALRVIGKVPGYGNQTLLGEDGVSPLQMRGDGQVDVPTWLSIGGSLWPRALYGFLDVGYRHRTEAGPAPIDSADYRDGLTWILHGGYAGESLRGSLWSQGVFTPNLEADTTTRSVGSVGASGGAHVKGGLWVGVDVEVLVLAINGTRGQSVGLGLSLER